MGFRIERDDLLVYDTGSKMTSAVLAMKQAIKDFCKSPKNYP